MIRTAILIEDNPGDARLLREMFHEEDDPHPIDLTHVESMGEAESSRMVDRVVRAYSDRSTNAQSPPIIDASRSTEPSPPEVQAGPNRPLRASRGCSARAYGNPLVLSLSPEAVVYS